MIGIYEVLIAAIIGVGATLIMDIWALASRRIFGTPPPDYCLVGRWFCYMPAGKLFHQSIAKSAAKSGECLVGWLAHYFIGCGYAVMLVLLTRGAWIEQPSLWLALIFGLFTLIFPFFVMQPCFGLGIASAHSPNPKQARLKSVLSHSAFGIGLYIFSLFVIWLLSIKY